MMIQSQLELQELQNIIKTLSPRLRFIAAAASAAGVRRVFIRAIL